MVWAAGGTLSPAQAAPLDATRVAGDATVVLHLDIDRLRETKVYEQYLAMKRKEHGQDFMKDLGLPEWMQSKYSRPILYRA